MKLWKKATLITVSIVLLLAGFVAFVLPVIVKNIAVQRIETATGRKLAIGGIAVNPFTWTVVIRDFRFSETGGGETFAAFSSARITVSPATIYRRVPVIAAAHITSPNFRIVRVGTNLYNFSDLLKWLPLHPRLSVNNLTITNGSVDFIDRGLPVEKRHELRKIELAVPFITTMKYYANRYITPRLSVVVNGSPLLVEGKLRPFPRAVEASANLEFKDVSIPYYLAYLPAALPVRVETGKVSAKVVVTYQAAQLKDPELALSGSLALVDMKLADRTGAPFLALSRLDAGITRARPMTGDFDLSSISADGLEVFLTRDKKGVWSHSRLAGGASPGAVPHRKALISTREPKGETRDGRKKGVVRIGTVIMQDGTLTFTDQHVTGGYTTTLYNLRGRVSGLSSEENRFADVNLRGSLENRSPLRITGRINPLRDSLFANLKVSFTNIKLSPLSPYSGTYFGYAVDKGQLYLDSVLRIENRELVSENRVVIEQLQFGKRVESNKTIAPSVRLATALLEDRKGVIRLDLPVTGKTDDPQFSVWRVVLKILDNLLVKAATSPFALLQSMSGGNEDLSSIGFAYGSTELSPGDREKLLKLVSVLGERPGLKIGIVGFVDREHDSEGYRNEQQLRSLAEARAAGVRAFIVNQGKMDPARVFQKSGDIYRAPEKAGWSGSRVEFEVAE